MEGASFEKIEAGASKHILQFSKFSEVRGSSGALKIFVCVCVCMRALVYNLCLHRRDILARMRSLMLLMLPLSLFPSFLFLYDFLLFDFGNLSNTLTSFFSGGVRSREGFASECFSLASLIS
jgi:hypothetical protein